MGADRGILISDRRFAGADVVATSYTLSQGIQKSGTYDLILCGKQTTDGDTAQVGPEMAEFLKIEHVSNVLQVLEVKKDEIVVLENQETQVRKLSVPLPCLLTIEKDANTPRLPSFKRKMERIEQKMEAISLDDFSDQNQKHYGLAGSPTQVERIFPPEKNTDRQVFTGSAAELAERFTQILKQNKYI
jgi:electron transfer flavoprotein beta subunit